MNKMRFVFIDKVEMPNTWNAIWDRLAVIEGISECWNNGEVWEYIGSRIANDEYIHTFRHRCHPKTNKPKFQTMAIAIMGVN